MARSYFIVYPGLPTPQQFRPEVAPALLTLQEVWEHSRHAVPSLVFRVRSESDPGMTLTTSDRLESCVGMVDAAVRWRATFNMAHTAAAAVQHPVLGPAVQQALAFSATRHPASVSVSERRQMLTQLGQILHSEEEPKPHIFEALIAGGVAQLCQADNDIEASYCVPFVKALCPFSETEQREQFAARMSTLETMSGAVLLTEAQRRLAERMPVWMVAQMPELSVSGAEED